MRIGLNSFLICDLKANCIVKHIEFKKVLINKANKCVAYEGVYINPNSKSNLIRAFTVSLWCITEYYLEVEILSTYNLVVCEFTYEHNKNIDARSHTLSIDFYDPLNDKNNEVKCLRTRIDHGKYMLAIALNSSCKSYCQVTLFSLDTNYGIFL